MNMGQIKLIHEHYDSKRWVGIISGTLVACLAILKLVADRDSNSWFRLFFFSLAILPSIIILVMDIIWKKKPIVVVYNDRLEVRKTLSSKRTEILYSDIKNMALEAGQLRIWLDEYSQPSCYNMGADLDKAQESYDILRTAYDGYNQEHNFKTVPLVDLPKRRTGLTQVVFIVAVLCFLVLFLILEHTK